MKDQLAAFALMAAAGTIVSCSARVSDRDPRDQGSTAMDGSGVSNAALYAIRYGFRGGPYTYNGKPRPKSNAAPALPGGVLDTPM